MSMLDALRKAAPHVVEAAPNTLGPVANWNAPVPSVFGGRAGARNEVGDSAELRRVLNIARRAPVDLNGSAKALALVELMSSRLRRATRACTCAKHGRPCITELKPAQAWALHEAPLIGGLFAPIGVGQGKTGLDVLMAMVMNSKLAVLLIPPGLQEQLWSDYQMWSEHFNVPSIVMPDRRGLTLPGRPVLHVVPFSKFSRADATEYLESLKPDLVIVDEAQNLRHKDTARTGRFLRYFANNPSTRLCCWSGTMTAKSIRDYAHLIAIALRANSPLPLDPNTVEEWALAIDPSDWPAPAGELMRLCAPGENLYQGFQRRLKETRGVVSTVTGAVDASINIHERKAPEIPLKLQAMLDDLRAGWVRPDGEELVDILSVARSARELACGFFYRWKFPKGEPVELIEAWFAARKAWCKELRMVLRARLPHLDSPQLCTQAAIRFLQGYKGDLPVWESETYEAWRDIKDRVYHETEAVWVDDYLAHDAAAWGKKHRGVLWYEHEAFGKRVSELSGLPMHGGGQGAEGRILSEKGDRSIIASIHAHGTGRDGLQRLFFEQLVMNPPASGDKWEQLLGRLHRIGQKADEVNTWVYRHVPEIAEAIDKAVIQAKYIEGTMGQHQKLLSATCSFSLDID